LRIVLREACWQICIGDKDLAKSQGIRFAGLNSLLCLRSNMFLIRDVDAAELLLELRTQSVGLEVRARQQKGKFTLA
jgi:hypothetical protein